MGGQTVLVLGDAVSTPGPCSHAVQDMPADAIHPPSAAQMANIAGIVGLSSVLILLAPVAAQIATACSGSLLFLDYVRVITGGTWTGIDLFMGLVMIRVLRGLPLNAQARFVKELVPMTLFFTPALASVAITAGVCLATWEGLCFFSFPITAAGVIVIILTVQGFGIIIPNEVRDFLELRKERPDVQKVVKLGMRRIYLSGSQSVFQIALIAVMALLAVG